MENLSGRVAVVTGAASGIGLAMAERFAAEGMRLVLADIEEAPLESVAAALRASGHDVETRRTDVSDAAQIEALADAAYGRFGAVNVLCNNAGVVSRRGPAWAISADDWNWVLNVDLFSVIHGIRSFVPRMLAGGDEGHIVNTASMAGLLAFAGIAPYDVAKFGVVALSEACFHDLGAARERIGVSVLCPGVVATRIGESDRNRPGGPASTESAPSPPARAERPRATVLQPAEVAAAVVDAIHQRRFWILTHDGYHPFVAGRALGIISGADPQPTPVL